MGDKETIAAIDIGSNAIRMVVAEISREGEQCRLQPMKKFRVPIRLGADVFESGKISGRNLKASTRALSKFCQWAGKHKVDRIRAVGTSALREAGNQRAFLELIRRKTGIAIEVIDGRLEAQMIFRAVRRQVQLENARALLIDVGGGSVELTFCDQGRIQDTQSFPFGTVRTLGLLKKRRMKESQMNLVIGDFIRPLSEFIHQRNGGRKPEFAVGTGGNLEALGRMKSKLLGKNSPTEISDAELEQIIRKLRTLTYKERIQKLGLRPDRADVIIPAAMVVQAVLRQTSIHRLVIPYVGLKDGLLWEMAMEGSASSAEKRRSSVKKTASATKAT